MPRSQQHHAHKSVAQAERLGDLVVAQVGVIAQHQDHARTRGKLLQGVPDALAALRGEELVELAGVRMLERKSFHLARLQVLPDAAPPQKIPTVVRRHFVEPGAERPRSVVLAEFAFYL